MSKSASGFNRTETITLPVSGQEVQVRRPDPSLLVMQHADTGDVPQPITDQVLAMIASGGKVQAAATWAVERKDLPVLLRFINLIVRAALVWPTVVEADPDYEAGQIVMDDLVEVDRLFIYQWAWPEGAMNAAQSFRPEQNGHVEPAQPEPEVQPATE